MEEQKGGSGKSKTIQEAAIEVISRKGYFQTSVKEIAEEAGVSAGTIYNYFEDKQDILIEIFSSEFEDRKEFYKGLSEGDLSLFEQIKMILDRHFSKMADHEQLMTVIIQERFKPGSRLGRKLNERYEEVVLEIAELIEEALEQDQIRKCDLRVVASAMFGAVESVVAYGMLQDPETRDEIFDEAPGELAEFFWKGIKQNN